MEYYILKCYQEAKNRCLDVDQGFDRFEPKIKKIVIACLVAMFISCAEIIFTMLLLPKQLWYCIGIIILLIAMVILISVDNKDQRNHMDKYVDSHKKKIEVLDEVLQSKFQINNKEKIVSRDELMTYLWNNEEYINDNALTVNISRLRSKLSNFGYENIIETRKGQGYILL